jgi:hypothetical protein
MSCKCGGVYMVIEGSTQHDYFISKCMRCDDIKVVFRNEYARAQYYAKRRILHDGRV